MCLAKAYVDPSTTELDGEVLMENVTKVEVDGDTVTLTSLLGDTEELQARVVSIDFIESRLVLESSSAR